MFTKTEQLREDRKRNEVISAPNQETKSGEITENIESFFVM